MQIKRDITLTKFKEMTYDCDDFWAVIGKQNLWNALEAYIMDCFADENGIVDFDSVQDTLRYEGDSVLMDLGANL